MTSNKIMTTAVIAILTTITFQLAVSAADDTPGLPVGSEMVDFGLRRLVAETGKFKEMIWLSDFVGSAKAKTPKKLVVLNFFATWCKPCIAELPVLEALQQKYGSRGLQVLSVNFRTEDEKVDTAARGTAAIIKQHGLSFPVLFDKYTNRNQLIYMGSKATLPCSILIDASGKVVGRFQGAEAANLARLEKAIAAQLTSSDGP